MARWVLNGRLRVRERLTTGSRKTRDLSGVRVVISGTTTGAKWRQWGAVRTDDKGKFRLVVDKSRARRRFKIKVFLEDQFLRVMRPRFLRVAKDKGETQSAPIEILRDENRRTGQTIPFGTLNLDDGATQGRKRRQGRRAALWYVARRIQDELVARDQWLGFNEQLTVVYPSIWFTSGMGNRVRIASDNYAPGNPSYNLKDVIHEIMHIWNYQHNQGTTDWATAAIAGFDTHNRQEPPNVAFHEGFAEWASYALQHELWQRRLELPRNRFWIASDNDGPEVADMDEFERNDYCVTSALLLLINPYPYSLIFGTATHRPEGVRRFTAVDTTIPVPMDCPSKSLDLWDILLAFRGGRHANWPTDWEVGNRQFGLRRFFDRLSDIFPEKFPEETRNIFLRVLDPEGTEELIDLCSSV